jgi:hypothetical protein
MYVADTAARYVLQPALCNPQAMQSNSCFRSFENGSVTGLYKVLPYTLIRFTPSMVWLLGNRNRFWSNKTNCVYTSVSMPLVSRLPEPWDSKIFWWVPRDSKPTSTVLTRPNSDLPASTLRRCSAAFILYKTIAVRRHGAKCTRPSLDV